MKKTISFVVLAALSLPLCAAGEDISNKDLQMLLALSEAQSNTNAADEDISNKDLQMLLALSQAQSNSNSELDINKERARSQALNKNINANALLRDKELMDDLKKSKLYVLELLEELSQQTQRAASKRERDRVYRHENTPRQVTIEYKNDVAQALEFVANELEQRMDSYLEEGSPNKFIQQGALRAIEWIRQAVIILRNASQDIELASVKNQRLLALCIDRITDSFVFIKKRLTQEAVYKEHIENHLLTQIESVQKAMLAATDLFPELIKADYESVFEVATSAAIRRIDDSEDEFTQGSALILFHWLVKAHYEPAMKAAIDAAGKHFNNPHSGLRRLARGLKARIESKQGTRSRL